MKKGITYLLTTFFASIWTVVLLTSIITAGVIFSFESLRYTRFVEPKMEEVTPLESYEFMKNNPDGYIFLDVRTLGEYNHLHAMFSTSTPIATLFEKRKILSHSSDKPIYLICTTGRLAAVAYGYLQLFGFTNLRHIEGGVANWSKQGLPVNVGTAKVDPNFSLDIPINLISTSTKQ